MLNFMLAQLGSQVNKAASGAVKAGTATTQDIFSNLATAAILLKNFLLSIAILIGFYFLGKFIASRIIRSLQESQGESVYPDMESLINRFAVVGSVAVGVAAVMQFIFNLDFLQVIGFFGFGLSFAFQDLFKNLIAGAMIIIQNKFRNGDLVRVKSGNLYGKIMEIQTRCTILKAVDGTQIIVPNSELMNSAVICYTAHHTRRINFNIGIDFDADVKKAKEIVMQIMQSKPGILKTPPPMVIVPKLSGSMVQLNIRFWFDPKNKDKSWVKIRSELIEEIKAAFDQAGILIPYPLYTYLDKKREIGKIST